MKSLLICTLMLLIIGCAIPTQPGYWRAPDRADLDRQKDDLECQALASQAAQGAGGFTSSAPYRAAIYDSAKQRYYEQCLQTRGYVWVPPQ